MVLVSLTSDLFSLFYLQYFQDVARFINYSNEALMKIGFVGVDNRYSRIIELCSTIDGIVA
jgi:hypothetical protein